MAKVNYKWLEATESVKIVLKIRKNFSKKILEKVYSFSEDDIKDIDNIECHRFRNHRFEVDAWVRVYVIFEKITERRELLPTLIGLDKEFDKFIAYRLEN